MSLSVSWFYILILGGGIISRFVCVFMWYGWYCGCKRFLFGVIVMIEIVIVTVFKCMPFANANWWDYYRSFCHINIQSNLFWILRKCVYLFDSGPLRILVEYWFQGKGRAFCAGGDVAAVARSITEGIFGACLGFAI